MKNFFKNLFFRVRLMLADVFYKRKILVANKDALEKMEEFNKSIILTKLSKTEKMLADLSKAVTEFAITQKTNQEFIIYLCTINEEMLNAICGIESKPESTIEKSDSEIDPSKKNLAN